MANPLKLSNFKWVIMFDCIHTASQTQFISDNSDDQRMSSPNIKYAKQFDTLEQACAVIVEWNVQDQREGDLDVIVNNPYVIVLYPPSVVEFMQKGAIDDDLPF